MMEKPQDTSAAYARLRILVINDIGYMTQAIEREQWDEAIRFATDAINQCATLLLMGDEA